MRLDDLKQQAVNFVSPVSRHRNMAQFGKFIKDAMHREFRNLFHHRRRCLNIFGERDDVHGHRACLQCLSAIKVKAGFPLVNQILGFALGKPGRIS